MRIALLRHPGFTALSIATLAAGLGLIAALASVADAIFFRPLPVARPGEVVRIFTATREQPLGFVSFPDFEDFRRDYPAVAQTQVLIAVGDPPIRMGLAVTPDYFDVLGVAPGSGRNFRPEDAGAPVVTLAYSFWRANPQAIGSVIRLGRTSFTVIGVAPEDFGLDRFIHEDYYVCTGAFAAGLLPVHFAIMPRIDARVALSIVVAAMVCGAAAARSKPMAVRTRWRGALVTVEIALASLLIASDAMLLERIARTRNIDLGYRTEGVFVAVIDPAQAGYDEVRARAFYAELIERIRHLRGVSGVALAQSVPLAYTGAQREIAIEGEAETVAVWMNVVTEDYFDLMRMRPLAGRVFDRRDTAAGLPVAVVNQELAKRCGIGCSFRMNGHAVKVVGVTPSARYFQIGEPPRPFFYLPFSQNYASRMALHVDGGAPSEILNAIRQQDPGLPVSEARMLADYARQGAMFHARIASYTIGAVGIGGLILALAGLYGLVSCDAARRRREIGIRMALGAQRIVVVRVLFAKFFWRSLASASAGSAAAIACAPSLATVSGADNLKVWPAVISAGLVLVLSLCAGLIPAWRASGIDPALVLRQD
ncbi:MAG TPA: ABC transporter permease [Bryobacteraceae bacterium]|nr:ABC transporter permease [Bryobacteraceae bacterium]